MTRTLRSTIIPQRHDGKAWHMCDALRATGWLAVPLKGQQMRFASKRAAREYNQRMDRLAKPSRTFALGSRCPQRLPTASLIATSTRHKPTEY